MTEHVTITITLRDARQMASGNPDARALRSVMRKCNQAVAEQFLPHTYTERIPASVGPSPYSPTNYIEGLTSYYLGSREVTKDEFDKAMAQWEPDPVLTDAKTRLAYGLMAVSERLQITPAHRTGEAGGGDDQ